jgi:hypothetical protein
MRPLRSFLAGTVILGLLASLSLSTAAQEEPAPVTFVTGTVAEVYGYYGDVDEDGHLDSHDIRGYEAMTQTSGVIREVVEWSDPRLPTDLWLRLGYTLIWKGEDEPDVGAINTASRILLQDEAGIWRGTGRFVKDADEPYSLYELTGEGAYEGLSALLRGLTPADAHGPWDLAYEGYIFEAELTPFPEEPVPVTSGAYQVYPFPTEAPAE